MREILFRGKCGREWSEGCLIKRGNTYCICPQEKVLEGENCSTTMMIWHEVNPETVGQFTGLIDLNGKKVFEGDIVKATISINDFSRDRVQQQKGIYKVEYHTKHCYFYLAKEGSNLLFDGNWHYYLKDIEVIGNIHDNSDLLKE